MAGLAFVPLAPCLVRHCAASSIPNSWRTHRRSDAAGRQCRPSSRGRDPVHCSRSSSAVVHIAQAEAGALPAKAPPPVLGLLSTVVGVLVLVGSFLYKVPQVLRIARRRSGEGISVAMYALETVATSMSALYFLRRGFAFSTYGECFFIVMQNMIILAQILAFEKLDRGRAALAAVLYLAGVAILLSPAAPLKLLMALQLATIPILNFARIPQIVLNWQRKSTGELSPITLTLQVAGNIARVFTTIVSVGDWLMLLGVVVSTVFNGTLVAQYVHYNKFGRTKQAV